MELTAISWNLFHGRDFPPDPALFSWRSRLLRRSERNATHVQVNRELEREFCALLAGAEWDVALLQECPPRWWGSLADACDAEGFGALTSRNSFGRARALAARLNPDLVASAEGGSNLTLIRRRFRCALSTYSGDKAHRNGPERHGGRRGGIERRELAIHTGPLERRAMVFVRIAGGGPDDRGDIRADRGDDGVAPPGLCVANLHASAHRPDLAAADVLRAAAAADSWAAADSEGARAEGPPLILGGDFNLRPGEGRGDGGTGSPGPFAELERRYGLTGTTGPSAIDHLLSRGLETLAPPRQWPPERRELGERGRALRLSDHAPVEARFAFSTPK